MIDSPFPIETYEQYPQFIECLDYLTLRRKVDKNGKKYPPQKIAIMLAEKYPGFGASMSFMYSRVHEWRSDGTLAAAEKFLLNEQMEEIRVVIDEIITEYPDMLRGIKEDAKNAKTPADRLRATQYLREEVLSAKLDQRDSGAQEKLYVSRTANFNPTDID